MANGIKIGNDNATYKVGSTDVSAIYLGNDLVYAPSSGLPAGYTQVEYVENDSLAYIDTGFKPNQDTRIIAEMQVVTSTSYNPHFGCDGWETYNGIRMGYESGINGTLHVKYGNNNGWTVYPNVHGDLNKHTYDWNKNYFYMDGSLVGSYTYGNFQTTSNLGIFFVIENGSPTSQYICKARIYLFKIYDNGTLVRDFVPCTRDSDSKAGVYDIVNDVFYSSANSGYELIAPQTGYTYSVTITGLENGDTTNIRWNTGIQTDYNVGNGTYTYTTTADTISVDIDMVANYGLDHDQFMLYSGGSQTVTFTHQQTTYTYSVTITGLENGDTTRIFWDAGHHTDSNVGNGTYTYTTTADAISVNLDMGGLSDYTVDHDQFMLYSGGSQTVTFTYQGGGGGGLESIPYGTNMSQYVGRSISRIVVNDTTTSTQTNIFFNSWADAIFISSWNVTGQGQFGSLRTQLPIDISIPTPAVLASWGTDTNTFNDLQIEWA